MAKKHRISIIPLSGQIFASDGKQNSIHPDQVRHLFDEAIKHKSKLVILDINSPGGSPVGSTMVHNMILSLREKKIKVVAHCRDVCASGGYLIVSACDEIHGYKSSLIGSIGVITSSFGLDKLLEKYDVDYREYTAGKNKSMLNMFKPVDDEGEAFVHEMLEDVHQDFIDIVYSARKNEKLIEHKEEVITAKVFTGSKALSRGMIDGHKTIKDIIESEFGKDPKLNIHRPKQKESFIKKILGGGLSVKLDLSDLMETKLR